MIRLYRYTRYTYTLSSACFEHLIDLGWNTASFRGAETPRLGDGLEWCPTAVPGTWDRQGISGSPEKWCIIYIHIYIYTYVHDIIYFIYVHHTHTHIYNIIVYDMYSTYTHNYSILTDTHTHRKTTSIETYVHLSTIFQRSFTHVIYG